MPKPKPRKKSAKRPGRVRRARATRGGTKTRNSVPPTPRRVVAYIGAVKRLRAKKFKREKYVVRVKRLNAKYGLLDGTERIRRKPGVSKETRDLSDKRLKSLIGQYAKRGAPGQSRPGEKTRYGGLSGLRAEATYRRQRTRKRSGKTVRGRTLEHKARLFTYFKARGVSRNFANDSKRRPPQGYVSGPGAFYSQEGFFLGGVKFNGRISLDKMFKMLNDTLDVRDKRGRLADFRRGPYMTWSYDYQVVEVRDGRATVVEKKSGGR